MFAKYHMNAYGPRIHSSVYYIKMYHVNAYGQKLYCVINIVQAYMYVA